MKLPRDNFVRCQAAIQLVVSCTIPCLQHIIDSWHEQARKRLPPCSNPSNCNKNKNKKPSPKSHCQECINWMHAIEAEVFPSTAINKLQWKNANPALFGTDPLEVMKLFTFVIPHNKTISTLDDLDTGSVLMIMSKFSDFHQGSQMVADAISKVRY